MINLPILIQAETETGLTVWLSRANEWNEQCWKEWVKSIGTKHNKAQ